MAATSGINRSWRRSSTARLRSKVRDLELFGNGLVLLLSAVAVLLMVRFTVTGLGLAVLGAWGIGLVSATSEVVGPFHALFGAHPLADLGAAVAYGAAAWVVQMLVARRPLPRLSLPIAWGSPPAALN